MARVPDWASEVDALVVDLRQQLGHLPYDVTPDRLYRASDFYEDLRSVGFPGCTDQRIYQRARKSGGPPISPVESLVQRLHDHGITVALDRFREGRNLVGVMGGHAMIRGSDRYRQVVALGRALATAGYCVVTGGGPGAMEAANLGAATSRRPADDVEGLVSELASQPSFGGETNGFIGAAYRVWEELDDPTPNLSLPTWFYGHEPTNPFATHIAKYFSNSEREDGLLAICTAGIVFVPGGPGTMQEVFQDAAQNAYRTFGNPSPMVFLDPPDHGGGVEPWWEESGSLAALDRSFSHPDGSRRPGWDLVANVSSINAVLEALAPSSDPAARRLR